MIANKGQATPIARPIAAPIVIGHRGASGYVPEHTLTSYFIAIQQGADYIEPDLVATKDGILVARHENEIGGTTNIASHLKFADRKTSKMIDGQSVEGWFTEDFTLAELKTLRTRERLPALRVANTRFDNQFLIPTFDEILAMVAALEQMRGPKQPRIGVYPETKHPSYFRSIGLPLEDSLLEILNRFGYRDASAPIFIQSFEVGNLQALRKHTSIPMVQLMEANGAPFDFRNSNDQRSYRDLVSKAGLQFVVSYANAIGVDKTMILPRDAQGTTIQSTSLIANAHAAGLQVHAWTLRAENQFLPRELRSSDNPADYGQLDQEIAALMQLNIDGFFADHPALAVAARDRFRLTN